MSPFPLSKPFSLKEIRGLPEIKLSAKILKTGANFAPKVASERFPLPDNHIKCALNFFNFGKC